MPQAYVYPAEMRATRDLLRRRCHLARKRAELLAHIPNTNSQYNLPEIGKRLADKANREDVADHFPDPSVRKPLKSMCRSSITRINCSVKSNSISRGVPKRMTSKRSLGFNRSQGSGRSWRLVLLYEIQDIARFPRVQDFVSYCRLVKCTKESNGKRLGTSGKKIGNVHLRWAFAEAAVLFLRQSQPGKVYFTKLEHKHGKAKALTVLAHKLGRAVYYMLTREQAFDLQRFVSA